MTLSSAASSLTKITPIPMTATFSKPVTNFVAGSIVVGNGTVSNFAGSGAVYTFDVTPSGEGAVTVSIAAGVAKDTDLKDNTAATPLTRTFDTTAPTEPTNLTLRSPATTPNTSTTPQIRVWDVVSGDTVAIYTSNTCATPSLKASGTASGTTIDLTSSSLTANNSYTFYADSVDPAGNRSTCTAANVTYAIDTAAPTIAITTPSTNSYINIASDSATYAVNGTCSENGRTVTIKVNGTSVTTTGGVCDGTNFSSTIDSTAIAAGARTLTAVISDAAGNSTTSSGIAVTRDVTAPTIAITTPAANSYINVANDSTTFAVNGSCSENGRTVTIYVDGAAVTTTGGACNGTNFTSTIDSTAIAAGARTLTAVISDAAGNSTTSSGIAVTRDVTAPTIAITTPAASSYINIANDSTTYAVNGTCSENGKTVTIKVGGTAVTTTGGTCDGTNFTSTIDSTAIAAGARTLTAVISDAAGNSTTSSGIGVTRDVTAPSAPSGLTRQSPSTTPDTDTTPTIRVSGVVSGDTVEMYTASNCTGLIASDVATGTTIDLTSSALTAGAYTFYAKATDPAGNASACSSANVAYTVSSASVSLEFAIEMITKGVASAIAGDITYERSRTYLDTSYYDGSPVYSFEINARNQNATTNYSVTLVNSAGTTLATISIPMNTASFTRYRTTFTPTVGSDSYRVVTPQTSGATNVTVNTARIMVQQTNATKTRIYYPLSTTQGNFAADTGAQGAVQASTSSTFAADDPTLGTSFHLHKKDTSWLSTIAAGTPWTFEAILSGPNGVATAEAGLFNYTTGLQVAGTTLSTASTTPAVVSTNIANDAVNFSEGDCFIVKLRSPDNASTVYLQKAGLWVELTNLTRVEIKDRVFQYVALGSTGQQTAQRFLYDQNLFTNPTTYFEAVGIETTAGDIYLTLNDDGTVDAGGVGASVVGSDINFDPATAQTIRTGAITITDDHRYSVRSVFPTTGVIRIDVSYLVIRAGN